MDGMYWDIQKAFSWSALLLIIIGCGLIAVRTRSAWPRIMLVSVVVWALAAIGVEIYFRHVTPSTPFFGAPLTYFIFDHRMMLASVAMFVASLSFLMVARTIGRPNQPFKTNPLRGLA